MWKIAEVPMMVAKWTPKTKGNQPEREINLIMGFSEEGSLEHVLLERSKFYYKCSRAPGTNTFENISLLKL